MIREILLVLSVLLFFALSSVVMYEGGRLTGLAEAFAICELVSD